MHVHENRQVTDGRQTEDSKVLLFFRVKIIQLMRLNQRFQSPGVLCAGSLTQMCLHAPKYPVLVIFRIMAFTQNMRNAVFHIPVYMIIMVSRFLVVGLQACLN